MLRHVARIPAISRIPTEILIMIFVIYLEACKKAKKWDLIYVCRAWKTAVLCMPHLWTRINFRAPDWIREHYIQRSGSRPLDVFIPTVQPPQGLTSLIISDTVARARKLTVLSTHKKKFWKCSTLISWERISLCLVSKSLSLEPLSFLPSTPNRQYWANQFLHSFALSQT
ncbi:hypothetical protein SISNIDRAFT_301596 [Sistotremastrum niveocremeum HHB9708]|uniref:Uncharacterized protein n=1 Tax=Sistotremastrum niveocremeum HHB9708 TaxID=1314777 RepID=A0A164N832_9AGAM|nr:hypothetical protein SISNIDRAFT_301596 [Sistotremastrum niveocremeum HHB9708]